MLRPLESGRTGIPGAAERLLAGWALFGGLALIAMVGINVLEVTSVLTRPITGRFSGSAELTSLLAAVAAFSFLPYCQLTDANVTADIFTARAPRRMIALLKFLGSVAALGFGCLLLWRMSIGMTNTRASGLSTTILNVPIWPAYAVALVSLALLILAALVTLFEQGREAATGEHTP